jgi:hypothetical protein
VIAVHDRVRRSAPGAGTDRSDRPALRADLGIADALAVTEAAVEKHVTHIFAAIAGTTGFSAACD